MTNNDLTIGDRVNYLTKEMKIYNNEIKDVTFEKYDKETLDRVHSCLSDIGVYSNKNAKEKIRKEFNDMVNDKVKQFIDLLLDGESLENAMDKSGVGEMKVADVLRAITCSEYVEEISNIFAGVKEANAMQTIVESAKAAIQTVRELDESLVELTKVTDTSTQELEDLYESVVKSSESSDKTENN